MPVLISPVGRYASATQPYTSISKAQNDAQREVLRQQYLLCLSGDANVFWGATHLGLVHFDAYHYLGTGGYDTIAVREAFSVAKYVYGVNVHDGRGPVVISASRTAAVITLTLDLNGATGLTDLVTVATGTTDTQPAGSLYGYQVSADNFATLLTISSMVRSGNNLVITLSADPGGPVKVRSFYGWSYADADMFYGTYSDTANIPVWPIITPLTAL